MKNVFITGATSFIGLNLISKLNKEKYNIIALIRENSDKKYKLEKFKNIKIIELNNERIMELPNLVNEKCDIFYHLAWNGTRGISRNDKNLQKSNYLDSINALKVANSMECKIFVSAGSQAEYGLKNDIITEKTSCNPNTEYGKWKLEFYNYASKYAINNNIRFIEPRFFSLYGIGDFENTLIINTLKKMENNMDVELTQCIQLWNFLYIEDAIEALIKLQESNCSGVYNFGTDDTRILKEFIEEMYEITKSKSKVMYGKIPYINGIVNVNPCIKKLKTDINWIPKTTFSNGIKKILNYKEGVK